MTLWHKSWNCVTKTERFHDLHRSSSMLLFNGLYRSLYKPCTSTFSTFHQHRRFTVNVSVTITQCSRLHTCSRHKPQFLSLSNFSNNCLFAVIFCPLVSYIFFVNHSYQPRIFSYNIQLSKHKSSRTEVYAALTKHYNVNTKNPS